MNLQQTLQELRNYGITPTAVSYSRFSSDNQRGESIRESQSVQTLDVAQMKLLINMAKELLNDADSNASRRLVDTFIEKVLVYKDRIEVQLNAAPFLSKSKYAKMVEVLPRYPI